MESKTKKQKKSDQSLPNWFNGELYSEGGIVTNPFSGESYELTAVELSMYDFIIGSQTAFDILPHLATDKRINEFHEALRWFRENNPKAYYVLLDQLDIHEVNTDNRIGSRAAENNVYKLVLKRYGLFVV